MLKQLEKEAEEDEEIYDKMACWCETNDKEKTKSIADAEARISDLTTKIEELTASSARLNTEIKNLEKDGLPPALVVRATSRHKLINARRREHDCWGRQGIAIIPEPGEVQRHLFPEVRADLHERLGPRPLPVLARLALVDLGHAHARRAAVPGTRPPK